MNFGLKQETIDKINSVFKRHPEVEEVIIYGSRAKGTHHEGSDIDITLKGTQLNETIRTKISQEIDDLNTPYLFDISIYHKLSCPALLTHIHQAGKRFYSRDKS